MSKHKFKTEVNQLLHLIVHSLYSNKEIFLRELISNSSDALDKLKYLTLSDENFKKQKFVPRVDVSFDGEGEATLIVSDSGIGMNKEDLNSQLGTIARSGTKNFFSQLTGDSKSDMNLIGQFGVGFYSAFMVADSVEVISKKAGEEQAWKWVSDGKNGYTISEAEREGCGTTVIAHLNSEGKEFANRWQIETIIKKYSDHIPFPIFLHYEDTTYEGEGKERKEKKEKKVDQVNAASAIWTRSKFKLKDEDYKEFYKTLSHDNEDPMYHVHTKAEGTQEYTTLFFVPKKAPFDMFNADYRPGVKLYVKRVFIMDDSKELLPSYLRFVRGIIDSEDLPLNVSREILQKNRVISNIISASVKKLLGEFKEMSEKDKKLYSDFVEQYNRPLKEGLYSDYANREVLLELVRFKSTGAEGFTGLSDYKDRMKPDQKAIYYITGGNEDTLRNSPLLEAYKKKDIEVLIMDDDIDEIVVPSINRYKDIELKAVNRSGSSEDLEDQDDEKKKKEVKPLLKKIKKSLGESVKDVIASSRLSDSPSCIVADENDPTMQMQHMLKAMGQDNVPDFVPILEINPDHDIVKRLIDSQDNDLVDDVSHLLFEQAMLVEGAQLKKPAEFVKRLNRIMEKAV
ncbi:MAG: molecular chaperone HtpG [Deltaproteobacteria bacterium]|nr:molecular chaperone HtpG [Deltaproteobacteria bacterium]